MARWLNSLIICCLMIPAAALAQMQYGAYNKDDYKNKDQFEKFQKRRKTIGAWQINELKTGALVVKLKTNGNLISELEKNGRKEEAEQKRIETWLINRNLMQAFRDHFDFCKVYFVYSSAGDSLTGGARKGIFLDSNLTVDPNIELTEKFYMIAERDYVYNSSIGFVPEDSARYVKEQGNPSGEQAELVLKNKYGHQLKKPFPYVCGYGNKGIFDMAFVKKVPHYYTNEGGRLAYTVDKTQLERVKNSQNREFQKAPAGYKTYVLDKSHAYEIVASKVQRFQEELNNYYRSSPKPQVDKLDKEILPYLY